MSLIDFRLSVCPPLHILIASYASVAYVHVRFVNGHSEKNDANQANTNLRSNYPEEVVTRRHRVRASQGCLARIVELDQRSQFKP